MCNSKKTVKLKTSLNQQSIISSDGVEDINQDFTRGRVETPKNPGFDPN